MKLRKIEAQLFENYTSSFNEFTKYRLNFEESNVIVEIAQNRSTAFKKRYY